MKTRSSREKRKRQHKIYHEKYCKCEEKEEEKRKKDKDRTEKKRIEERVLHDRPLQSQKKKIQDIYSESKRVMFGRSRRSRSCPSPA